MNGKFFLYSCLLSIPPSSCSGPSAFSAHLDTFPPAVKNGCWSIRSSQYERTITSEQINRGSGNYERHVESSRDKTSVLVHEWDDKKITTVGQQHLTIEATQQGQLSDPEMPPPPERGLF